MHSLLVGAETFYGSVVVLRPKPSAKDPEGSLENRQAAVAMDGDFDNVDTLQALP